MSRFHERPPPRPCCTTAQPMAGAMDSQAAVARTSPFDRLRRYPRTCAWRQCPETVTSPWARWNRWHEMGFIWFIARYISGLSSREASGRRSRLVKCGGRDSASHTPVARSRITHRAFVRRRASPTCPRIGYMCLAGLDLRRSVGNHVFGAAGRPLGRLRMNAVREPFDPAQLADCRVSLFLAMAWSLRCGLRRDQEEQAGAGAT